MYCRTKSSSLKQKLEILRQPFSDTNPRCGLTHINEWTTNETSPLDEIQARLWSLLQKAMVDPRAWPRWNPSILDLSTLPCRSESSSYMLDDDPIDLESGPGSLSNDPEYASNDPDTLLDDVFDFDDSLFNEENDMYNISSVTEGVLLVEDDFIEEDLFWAALDVDQALDEEALCKDSPDSEELLEQGLSAFKDKPEETEESSYQNLPKDDWSMSRVDFYSNRLSAEAANPHEPWDRKTVDQAIDNLELVLDDDIAETLDEYVENCHEEGLDDNLLDEPIDCGEILDIVRTIDESQETVALAM